MVIRRTLLVVTLLLPAVLLWVPQTGGQPRKDVLRYDAKAAFAYADKWCKEGNDCESKQYKDDNNTDCTHFISHVLKAGGVTVKGTGAACKDGLCIRVKELAVWFSEATKNYANVKKLASWKDARRGDFCFQQANLLGLNLGRKYHVMLLADAPKEDGAKVYGHEHNRCGEFVKFDVAECVYYRIEPPLDGAWKSADADARFSLKIEGDSVEWTERRTGGATLTRKVKMAPGRQEGTFVLNRPNDDEVLKFLDFPNAAFRKEILDNKPEPSTLILSAKGDQLEATWHGLLVRKKKDGHLQELVQPSRSQPKSYIFVRP